MRKPTIHKDTQIHLSVTHSRNKDIKKPVNRTFNLVIKGVLISTILFSTLVGCSSPDTISTNKTVEVPKVVVSQKIDQEYEEEGALLENLRLSTDVIKSSLKSGSWDENVFKNLHSVITQIETKLDEGGYKDNRDILKQTIIDTDKVVKQVDRDTLEVNKLNGVEEDLKSTVKVLESMKIKLGIPTTVALSREELTVNKAIKRPEVEEIKQEVNEKTTPNNKDIDKSTPAPTETTKNKDNPVIQNPVPAPNQPSQTNQTNQPNQPKPPINISSVENNNKETAKQNSSSVISKPSDKYKGYTLMPKGSNSGPSSTTTTEDIYVKYGKHLYGSRTQEEYDKVLETVEKAVKNTKLSETVEWAIDETLSGVRYDTYDKNNKDEVDKHIQLYSFQRTGGFMLTKVGKEDFSKFALGGQIMNSLTETARDPGDASPNSAYDILFRGRRDCDADAQLRLVISNIMGLSARVVQTGPNHAEAQIKVGDSWWSMGGSPVDSKIPSSHKLLVPASY